MSCALQIQCRMMEMSEDTLDIYKAFPPKREYIKHNGKFDFFFHEILWSSLYAAH